MHIAPPVGYQKLPSGEVVLDTDEQARDIVQLVFDKFYELGSTRKVLIYLVQHEIQLGIRINRGPRRGTLEWRQPKPGIVWRILTHPIYAGAYVFGRKEAEAGQINGKYRRFPKKYSADAWRILQKDRMPAYISWERYEANQERLKNNRSTITSSGVPRDGDALLAGIVICGTCGRRFRSHHPRPGHPYYFCARDTELAQERTCRGVAARVVDRLVINQVQEALKPAALKLSLRAIEDSQKDRDRLEAHWKKRLERARYEAERAERQYQAVEPENRLVARTLEQRWETTLLELRRLQDDYDRFSREKPRRVTEAQQTRIMALAQDIPTLWEAESTTNADRKEIIRCVIDQVVVRVEQNTERCDVTIQWKGGFASQHQIIRPVKSRNQMQDEDRLRERITELKLAGKTAASIAATLVAEGFVTTRQRGDYNAGIVQSLMRRYGLTKIRIPEALVEHEWRLGVLAKQLGIPSRKLRSWALQKWCHARRTENDRWIVWADQQEIHRLRQLAAQSARGNTSYPASMTTPKPRSK